MNAVIKERNTNILGSLEDLRSFAGQKESQVNKFDASLLEAKKCIENLTAERGSLLLSARSENNADAQKRLSDIDEQLRILRRDVADDEMVLAHLRAELGTARNNVYRAEWELRRALVREMIESRLKGKTAAAIAKAVEALEKALQTAKEEDEAIGVAMLQFDPSLGRDMKPLQMAGFERSRLASYKLENALLVDAREFGNSYTRAALNKLTFDGGDQRFYGELLERLDCLELVF